MKNFSLFIFLLLFIASSCSSPSKLIKNGQYDAAIEKLSKSLRTGKIKKDQLNELKQAYYAANQIDFDRITLLKSSGNPDIWSEVFDRYQKMDNRQILVKSLPDNVKKGINFTPIDLNADLNDSKARAQNYLYAKAERLLQTADKLSARKAYEALIELEAINPNYPGLDNLKNQANLQGTNQVLILFENQTGLSFPVTFNQEVLNFSNSDFNAKYVAYDIVENEEVNYDYVIYISLRKISVSPEKVETRKFVEQREVEDGTQPKRDENGNVMLDSTGKVIEVIRYKTIEALVNESKLFKSAMLSGAIEFVETKNKRTLHTAPFEVNSVFAHSFAIVNGDLKACTSPTLELMRRGPIPFPNDAALIMDASKQLNQFAKSTIRKERSIVTQTN